MGGPAEPKPGKKHKTRLGTEKELQSYGHPITERTNQLTKECLKQSLNSL